MNKKCGYFYYPDPLFDEDEESEDCNKIATHVSCNYGDVCVDHKCRCLDMKDQSLTFGYSKKEILGKISNMYNILGDSKVSDNDVIARIEDMVFDILERENLI